MRVREIFQTIQGEGIFAGAVTMFVRFAGCSLQCPDCDTQYSWDTKDLPDVGAPWIVDKIIDMCRRPRHICITGGEPLEQPQDDLFNLLQTLQGWHGNRGLESIVIETNGAHDISWLLNKPFRSVTHLSIDYKLPSTGHEGRMVVSNFLKLGPKDVIKFVCKDPGDAAYAGTILQSIAKHADTNPVVLFHTTGGQALNWLPEEIMKWEGIQERFDIRVGVQLHRLYSVR